MYQSDDLITAIHVEEHVVSGDPTSMKMMVKSGH